MSRGAPRRLAIIDQGSNTLLLLALELDAGGKYRLLAEEAWHPRLGEQVRESGRLSAAAMERSLAALEELLGRCRTLQAGEIYALGTSALRVAANAGDYLAAARERFGLAIQVVSEEDEARHSFALAAHHLRLEPGERGAVLDIGGSSTEVSISAAGDLRRAESLQSLPLGAVTFGERQQLSTPLGEKRRRQLLRDLALELAPLPRYREPLQALGTSGTYTTLAALARRRTESSADPVRGALLTRGELALWSERLCALSQEEIAALPGMDARRADVIAAGSLIALALAERLALAQLQVSGGGIRWGYFFNCLQG